MAPVSTERDLRLDLYRGLALRLIFLDHIPSNAVSWVTIRNYGFSDATEIFVFIAGYAAAFVYGRSMREHASSSPARACSSAPGRSISRTCSRSRPISPKSPMPRTRAALDRGVNKARAAVADVVFVNSQYSPRTESMIALATYTENMRWVAVQQEIPIFDRFNLMKSWADLGVFNLQSSTNKLDVVERIHDCIGRLLANLVVAAAKPN